MTRKRPIETPSVSSRRDFFQATVLAMAGADVLVGARPAVASQAESSQGADSITAATVAEAQKLHALKFGPDARKDLVPSLDAQVAAVRAVRGVARPRDLQPAITFDPRLPGVRYPAQVDGLRLHARSAPPFPDRDVDIAFAPVTFLAHWIRTRKLTSARLTEIYLERIARIGPKLLCWITVTEALARAQAERADREIRGGRYRGKLHGIPYGIKDLFDTAGVRTTWGAALFRERVPEHDAAVVAKLEEAGAVLLGKLATGALANGATWFGGMCRNPWNVDEPAGGSSTGSGSATAAGLCGFSIGTDDLGSILNPADRCGVVGLRATFGRVPTAGVMPLCPSLDRIGPIVRSVEDAALVLAAINGADPTSATSIDMGFAYDSEIDLRRIRVGYSPSWFESIGFGPDAVPVSAAHREALRVLRGLGVELVEVSLPELPVAPLIQNLVVEAATVFDDLTLDGRDAELPIDNAFAWPNVWKPIRFFSAVDYLQFERLRRQLMIAFHSMFERVDLLFGPTYGSFELLMAMNYTGHPGLGLRSGHVDMPTRGIGFAPVDPNGPPRRVTQNVAFHGRLFEEGKMLAVARALEERLGVAHERPPIDV